MSGRFGLRLGKMTIECVARLVASISCGRTLELASFRSAPRAQRPPRQPGVGYNKNDGFKNRLKCAPVDT